MKFNNITILVFLLLLFFSDYSYSQTINKRTFKKLICKEWKYGFFESEGEIIPLRPEQKDDKWIFYKNGKLKIFKGDTVESGFWSYNKKTITITMKGSKTNEKSLMQVLEITNNKVVFEQKKTPTKVTTIIHKNPGKADYDLSVESEEIETTLKMTLKAVMK